VFSKCDSARALSRGEHEEKLCCKEKQRNFQPSALRERSENVSLNAQANDRAILGAFSRDSRSRIRKIRKRRRKKREMNESAKRSFPTCFTDPKFVTSERVFHREQTNITRIMRYIEAPSCLPSHPERNDREIFRFVRDALCPSVFRTPSVN